MITEYGMWKANATYIEKYVASSPQTDEAIIRVAKGAGEVGFVGVRRDGIARWGFVGNIFVSRGDFAELERIVHEAASWLWEQEKSEA